MCLHFIIMFISSVLSWMLFVCDILLIAWLGYAKLNLDKDPRHWLTDIYNTKFASHRLIFSIQVSSLFGRCITGALWGSVLWSIGFWMGRQWIVFRIGLWKLCERRRQCTSCITNASTFCNPYLIYELMNQRNWMGSLKKYWLSLEGRLDHLALLAETTVSNMTSVFQMCLAPTGHKTFLSNQIFQFWSTFLPYKKMRMNLREKVFFLQRLIGTVVRRLFLGFSLTAVSLYFDVQ